MLIKNNVPYRVLLPKWVWDAHDREHFKKLLAHYMRRYPHYTVVGFEHPYAKCERRGKI